MLGVMLRDTEARGTMLKSLSALDFEAEFHRKIFQAIENLVHTGGEPGEEGIRDYLTRTGSPPEQIVFISKKVKELLLDQIGVRNIQKNIKILKGLRVRRDVIVMAGKLRSRATDQKANLGHLLMDASDHLSKMEDETIDGTIKPIGDRFGEFIGRLDRRIGGETGFKTNWKCLDDMICGGFWPQDVTVIAARPSTGKSALGLAIAHIAVQKATPILYFSLEMSGDRLLERLVSSSTEIPLKKIKTGKIDEEER